MNELDTMDRVDSIISEISYLSDSLVAWDHDALELDNANTEFLGVRLRDCNNELKTVIEQLWNEVLENRSKTQGL